MEPDWDLHAVVRGFAAINKSDTTAASAFTADVDHSISSGVKAWDSTVVKQTEDKKPHGFCSTNLAVADELHGLCTPPYMLDPRQTLSVQPTISSYFAALQAYRKRTQQQNKGSHLYGTTSASSAATPSQTTNKPKRRKNHQKKICHVPAEELSSDVWSWRKYGQKPIKGSPYPRSYYKCSSSKACLARKQVERNRSDPNMFIVTYTAEHNHPAPTHKNSLAGTTRNPYSLSSSSATAHEESNLPTSKPSSTNSTETMSPGGSQNDEVLQQSKETESMEVDTGGEINMTNLEDVMEFLDMDITDNFFGDLDKFSGSPVGFFFPDEFLPSFPWIANNGSSMDDTH